MIFINLFYIIVVDRSGVTEQMQEVMTKIIQNRPEDPIDFIAS